MSYKTNLIDTGSAKIIIIAVEVCSKTFQGLLKALEQRHNMFQKFVETRLLKK